MKPMANDGPIELSDVLRRLESFVGFGKLIVAALIACGGAVWSVGRVAQSNSDQMDRMRSDITILQSRSAAWERVDRRLAHIEGKLGIITGESSNDWESNR